MRKVSIEPIFPNTIVLPGNSQKIVYLDLNHWITLSKLRISSIESGQRNLFNDFVDHVENNRACFPLSLHTYVELEKNINHEQRKRLRHAIEEISRFSVVTSLHVVASHELEALLDVMIRSNPSPFGPVDYLDRGVMRAAGLDGRPRVFDRNGKDITEEYFEKYPDKEYLASTLREGFLRLNRSIIDGLSPENEAEFRNRGWDPEKLLTPYSEMAQLEQDLVEQLDDDPVYRSDPSRLKKLVSARYVYHLLNATMKSAFRIRGVEQLEEVFRPGTDDVCVLDRMPSFDVFVSLMTSLHKNPKHKWKQNHIHDVFALALTVPYCDIVVTDKEMTSHVNRTGVDKRMDTVVVSKLTHVSEHICANTRVRRRRKEVC